jgi:hypothetical protein
VSNPCDHIDKLRAEGQDEDAAKPSPEERVDGATDCLAATNAELADVVINAASLFEDGRNAACESTRFAGDVHDVSATAHGSRAKIATVRHSLDAEAELITAARSPSAPTQQLDRDAVDAEMTDDGDPADPGSA